MSAAFYCVADERYFLGAVGLVNSLRLVGHSEPIFLLDCGLTAAQRDLLASEVELVDGPTDADPHLLKTIAPLGDDADVKVLIDTDMIATRPMTDLIDRAVEQPGGGVVAFRDRQQRHFPEWGGLIGRGATVRRPYVSSGLVVFSGTAGATILESFADKQAVVNFELTFWRGNVRDYPFLYADQDVLNAVLSTAADSVLIDLDERLSATPPYRGLRLTDAGSLRCAYGDGERPFVVHQYVRKPWLEATFDGVYPRLLRRLLSGPGIALHPPEASLPRRWRSGARARAERVLVNLADYPRWRIGDRLPEPIATRVEERRRRRSRR